MDWCAWSLRPRPSWSPQRRGPKLAGVGGAGFRPSGHLRVRRGALYLHLTRAEVPRGALDLRWVGPVTRGSQSTTHDPGTVEDPAPAAGPASSPYDGRSFRAWGLLSQRRMQRWPSTGYTTRQLSQSARHKALSRTQPAGGSDRFRTPHSAGGSFDSGQRTRLRFRQCIPLSHRSVGTSSTFRLVASSPPFVSPNTDPVRFFVYSEWRACQRSGTSFAAKQQAIFLLAGPLQFLDAPRPRPQARAASLALAPALRPLLLVSPLPASLAEHHLPHFLRESSPCNAGSATSTGEPTARLLTASWIRQGYWPRASCEDLSEALSETRPLQDRTLARSP